MKYTYIDHGDYYEEIFDPNLSQHDDPSWPEPTNEALYGLAGEVVTRLIPNTESDQAALLLQFLVSFGNCVGRGPYFLVEGTKHYPNLFVVLAGQTAKARKGTSADRIRQLFGDATEAEASRHDHHAVLEKPVECRFGVGINLFHEI